MVLVMRVDSTFQRLPQQNVHRSRLRPEVAHKGMPLRFGDTELVIVGYGVRASEIFPGSEIL